MTKNGLAQALCKVNWALMPVICINVTGLNAWVCPFAHPNLSRAIKGPGHRAGCQKAPHHHATDPKIHYDLLRFCQHTRLAFPVSSIGMVPHDCGIVTLAPPSRDIQLPDAHVIVNTILQSPKPDPGNRDSGSVYGASRLALFGGLTPVTFKCIHNQ